MRLSPSPRIFPSLVLSLFGAGLAGTGLSGTGLSGTGIAAQEPVDYARDIEPIFQASCSGAFCHIGTATSGVELTTYESTLTSVGARYGEAIVRPFRSSESPLWDKIAQDEPRFGTRMPLGAESLPAAEIERIARWIDEGARATPSPAPRRGDLDGDGRRSLIDAVLLVQALFLGGAPPRCEPVADANADDRLDLADALFVLSYLFSGGPPPPALTPDDVAICGGTA